MPNDTAPLGFIPQVEHTFAYFDGSYGMMNEHQLSIGESTCGAKVAAYSPARGGEALMEASTLTRLALQRCKTARCAVLLMGDLAETYGFAGSEDPMEEGQQTGRGAQPRLPPQSQALPLTLSSHFLALCSAPLSFSLFR